MKSPAFTLIEVLVVISLTAILLGFGFAGFRQYSQRQSLFAAARTVKGDLRILQEKALAGEKIDPCIGKRLDGYRFDILPDNTQYNISQLCSGTVYDIENKNVASGFTVKATREPILFKVLGQGTDIPSGTSSVITLTQTGTTKTIQISINAEGSIQ